MQEDATLVKQTLAGEEQAFHCLIVKYQSAIYGLILSYVKNHHDAQELAQEVFLEAYRDLDSLRKPEQFQFWLRQIARHQCDDWMRKKRVDLVQIQESMVADVSQADELLILRETLAKVMQAIDELPETEKRLMKERYLDDASYAELQARHDLSSKALVMRLVRAREKVRESVKKALAGIGVLTWRKMLSGGVEAVKIGAKIKIIAIGVAGVLILGGAGLVLWHNQTIQEDLATNINQTDQQINKAPLTKDVSAKKPMEKPKEDKKDDKAVAQANLQKEKNVQEIKVPETKIEETIKPKEESKAGEFTLADMAARMPVLREEIRTGMGHINTRGDEVTAVIQSGNITPETVEWIREQEREINKEWKDLFFNKIGPYYAYKLNLEGRHPYPLAKGGEFYELAQLLPPHVFPREFDNPNAFSHIWLGDD